MWWAQLLNSIVALLESGAGGGGGSYESIATLTAAGGETSLTFSSIPSTYKHLQIRWIARTTDAFSGVDQSALTFNNDSSAIYTRHTLSGNGSSAAASGAINSTNALIIRSNSGGSNTAGIFASAIIDIIDYASTTKNKTVRYIAGLDTNSVGAIALGSSLYNTTSAINSIKIELVGFAVGAPMAAGSVFSLYGIKGA